jgi:hypothetical protein
MNYLLQIPGALLLAFLLFRALAKSRREWRVNHVAGDGDEWAPLLYASSGYFIAIAANGWYMGYAFGIPFLIFAIVSDRRS